MDIFDMPILQIGICLFQMGVFTEYAYKNPMIHIQSLASKDQACDSLSTILPNPNMGLKLEIDWVQITYFFIWKTSNHEREP